MFDVISAPVVPGKRRAIVRHDFPWDLMAARLTKFDLPQSFSIPQSYFSTKKIDKYEQSVVRKHFERWANKDNNRLRFRITIRATPQGLDVFLIHNY